LFSPECLPSGIFGRVEDEAQYGLNEIKGNVLTRAIGQMNLAQVKKEKKRSIEWNQLNSSYLNVCSQESFWIRGEKAKAESNENETYILS
jgi:hypothetical protein